MTHLMQRALLVVLLVVVGFSGFAWPLGLGEYALWPFSHTWFMFSGRSERIYQLELTGELQDGRVVRIPMRRWFNYKVGANTYRYMEVGRNDETLTRLAAFVCRRYNAERGSEPPLVRVSVQDTSWPIERGHLYRREEATHDIRSWLYVDRVSCGNTTDIAGSHGG